MTAPQTWMPSGGTTDIFAGTVYAGQIAAGAISTAELAAGCITADKIAAGVITADKIAAGSISASLIAANAITAGKIQAGSITAAEIAANAITAAKIAADSITAGQIAAGAIGADEIAASAITAGKLAAGAVTAGTVAASAITAHEIAANAITAAKIAANAITADKLNVADVQAAVVTAAKVNALTLTAVNITGGTISGINISGTTIDINNGGRLRSAASGQRIELSAAALNTLYFYTGQSSEVVPAYVQCVGAGLSYADLYLRGPRISGSAWGQAELQLHSASNGFHATLGAGGGYVTVGGDTYGGFAVELGGSIWLNGAAQVSGLLICYSNLRVDGNIQPFGKVNPQTDFPGVGTGWTSDDGIWIQDNTTVGRRWKMTFNSSTKVMSLSYSTLRYTAQFS